MGYDVTICEFKKSVRTDCITQKNTYTRLPVTVQGRHGLTRVRGAISGPLSLLIQPAELLYINIDSKS